MSFKIVSRVTVSASPAGVKPVDHVVLARERKLHPGEKIPIGGSITYDNEAKGGWISAKGELRVIDERTLGIRWRPSFGEGLFHGLVESESSGLKPKVKEIKDYLNWGEERIIKATGKRTIVDLKDGYSYPELPEVFSLNDRIRIKSLTENALDKVEGIKTVYRETELVYEA